MSAIAAVSGGPHVSVLSWLSVSALDRLGKMGQKNPPAHADAGGNFRMAYLPCADSQSNSNLTRTGAIIDAWVLYPSDICIQVMRPFHSGEALN